MPVSRRHPIEDDPRFAALAERIATRMRPLCAQMPEELFHDLVVDIACFRLRWTGDHAAAAPDEERPPSDDGSTWPDELDPASVGGGGPRAVLLAAVDAAMRLTGADMASARRFHPEFGLLRLEAQRGFDVAREDEFATTRGGEYACGTALLTGQPVIVEDVAESPLYADSDALDVLLGAGARAVTAVPLLHRGGRPLGVLCIYYRERRQPTELDLRILGLIAERTARLLEWTMAGPGAT